MTEKPYTRLSKEENDEWVKSMSDYGEALQTGKFPFITMGYRYIKQKDGTYKGEFFKEYCK
jgi:hypothetical protein